MRRNGKPKPVCHVTAHDGWQPKDSEDRFVPVCAPLLEILLQYRQSDGYLLNPEPNRKGRPRGGGHGLAYRYDPRTVWARVSSEILAAGGRRITMYGMRHTFASNLLIAGVTELKVARWLGHSDPRMVNNVYGHLLSYDADINAAGSAAGRNPLRQTPVDDN